MSSSFLRSLVCASTLSLLLAACSKVETVSELNPSKADPATVEQIVPESTFALNAKEQLGRKIYFDKNLSNPIGQACVNCHQPDLGFVGWGDGTFAGQFFVGGIGQGAVAGKFGARKPPSAAYATFSPLLTRKGSDFEGGLFWDGRATGARLNSTAAEQALGPFTNPLEHNMLNKKAVLDAIKNSAYAAQWINVWGSPISTANNTQINLNYDRVGLSIAAFEGSKEVNQFTSKFDAYLKGMTNLTAQEKRGMELFDDEGECYDCHTLDSKNGVAPLFTDFSYENIGVPKNPLNPVYWTNPSFIDEGLGAFLRTSTNADWKSKANVNRGKFKTPTLRNVAKMKRFMHNGVFTSLEEVVHFYNTRDVPGAGWNNKPWARPEYPFNLANHSKVGNLKLTAQDEADIVAFMHTLSDGWMK